MPERCSGATVLVPEKLTGLQEGGRMLHGKNTEIQPNQYGGLKMNTFKTLTNYLSLERSRLSACDGCSFRSVPARVTDMRKNQCIVFIAFIC